MDICLVSPPTVTDFDDADLAEAEAVRRIAEHAPVGILSLAAVLERAGTTPRLIDLNHLYYSYLRSDQASSGFCDFVLPELGVASADVIGFSTICSSYPLTIRMAEAAKKLNPHAVVILGGPQASVVDVATMKAFDAIDFIVRGEAEETFPQLLELLGRGHLPESLPGITFRRGDNIVRNPNAPVIRDLDVLPLPAFHLYPNIEKCRYIPLELGRGCPFACTFCSTNDFFRRNFRLKSAEETVRQMTHVKQTYGIATFDLIHDMFTVDRRKVVAFCEAVLASPETFYWNCSARTDCIDEELIALMAHAGCKGIFFGIETGSQRMQKLIQKDLDLEESARMIASTERHEITTAVSLIYGFPSETIDDVRDTVHFFADSLRHDFSAPQLHMLAPLAATPLEREYCERLTFDEIYSDISYQGWHQDPADRRMIAEHRDIFPNFYALPTEVDRAYLKELRDCLLNGMRRFRWLLVALYQDDGDMLRVFDRWRDWRMTHRPAPADLALYYVQADFRDDFLEFARVAVQQWTKATHVLSALLAYENAVISAAPDGSGEREPVATSVSAPNVVPTLADGVTLIDLDIDYKNVIRCLKRKGNLRRVRRGHVTIARRPSQQQTTDAGSEVLQLSPASAQLIRLCDGRRTVSTIVEMFTHAIGQIDDIPADRACIFGLEMLRTQKLIVCAGSASGSS